MLKSGSEEQLTFQLARYLQLQHPDVLAHFDFGSGTKLTQGQARKQRRLNAPGWPDLFIAKSARVAIDGLGSIYYHGLFIELKREGTRLRKRNGDWASEHLEEQAEVLQKLTKLGYIAQFAVGIDEAIELIDSYLEAKS